MINILKKNKKRKPTTDITYLPPPVLDKEVLKYAEEFKKGCLEAREVIKYLKRNKNGKTKSLQRNRINDR